MAAVAKATPGILLRSINPNFLRSIDIIGINRGIYRSINHRGKSFHGLSFTNEKLEIHLRKTNAIPKLTVAPRGACSRSLRSVMELNSMCGRIYMRRPK